MIVEAHGITDIGCVRTNNEDNFVCDIERRLFVVCDGMGGHAAGEVASGMACEAVIALIDDLRARQATAGHKADANALHDLVEATITGLEAISQKIIAAGIAQGQKRGMGTTCTVLWLIDDHRALVAHVGDSRLYLQSPKHHGLMTTDHTLVEEWVARGLMRREEAQRHPQAHVLSRALGASGGLAADCFVTAIGSGDTFLLCSDGLHAYLPDPVLLGPPWAHQTDASDASLASTLELAICRAKLKGGHDNLTGVLVHLRPAAVEPSHSAHPPLQHHLEALALYPPLQKLAPLMLRRLAAHVTRVDADVTRPSSGIFWPTSAPIKVSSSDHRATSVDDRYFAPEPLGASFGASSLHTVTSSQPYWHLSAEDLLLLCRKSPQLGAMLLAGLLCA